MAQQVAQEPAEAARGFGFDIRDPQRFAQNMARLVEETGKAVTAFIEPRVSNPAQALAGSGDFTHIMNALSQIQQAWLFQPQKLMEAQAELWQRYWQLWTSALAILTGGGTAEAVAAPDPKDARFKDPAWSENQYFDFMKQVYLINSRWAERLVEQAENVDPDTRHKAGFYMKQVINALAPSNWVFTNPELLRETFASDGENLVRGMQLLAEDIRRGGGDLQIRQTDFSKFAGSLESWLEKTQQYPGSWWPDWQAWIEGLDGERVPAREIGARLLKPIEDAPGSYVRVKG